MAHSSAARAAVENLTRVLSIEWARFGIRLTAARAPARSPPRRCGPSTRSRSWRASRGTVPLGRLGTEEEFAWLVAYLASPGRRLPVGRGAHSRRRARQLVRRVAAGAGSPSEGGQAARRGAAAEGVSRSPSSAPSGSSCAAGATRTYDALGGDPRRPGGRRRARRTRTAVDAARGLARHGVLSGPLGARGLRPLGARGARHAASSWAAPGSSTRRTGPALEVGLDGRPRALGQGLRARGRRAPPASGRTTSWARGTSSA